MPHAHQILMHRWFDEVWNQGNEASIDELMLPEGQCFDFPAPGAVIGREEFKTAVRGFRSTFSGIQVTVEDVIIEGDKVAVRWTASMQHTGPGLGFAATGQPVSLTGISITHLRDGRILYGWNALDLTHAVSTLSAFSPNR
jgi:predicted ester cyclase